MGFSQLDIQARVIRDYDIVGGITKEKQWLKREIQIREGTSQTRLTLWNEQVFLISLICTFFHVARKSTFYHCDLIPMFYSIRCVRQTNSINR